MPNLKFQFVHFTISLFLEFLLPFISALQSVEHEAPAAVRHGAVDVHGGGAEEALPADARLHEAVQRRHGGGRHRQGQARVSRVGGSDVRNVKGRQTEADSLWLAFLLRRKS